MLSINNHVQTQPNFQGRLFVEGVKLPQKKLEKVVQIFEDKTQGLPDAHLVGSCERDIDGKFWYEVSFDKFAKIITGDFKKLFKKLSAEEMADELANINKAASKNELNEPVKCSKEWCF